MIALAIDPGPTVCGWVRYDPEHQRVVRSGAADNVPEVLDLIWAVSMIVIARVSAQGVAANSLLQTSEVVGRCWQAAAIRGIPVQLLRRYEVCSALGVSGRGKDAIVRQRCLEILAGGDAKAARGSKADPGPCYGVAGHAWQALGLALAAERLGLLP